MANTSTLNKNFAPPIFGGPATAGLIHTMQMLNTASATTGTIKLKPTKAEADYVSLLLYVEATAETITMKGSNDDGTTLSGNLTPIDASTGLPFATSALTDGNFIIPNDWPYSCYKFTKSGAVTIATVALSLVAIPK